MDDRQKKLLQHIVEQYITTAEPIGSLSVVKGRFFDLSPATIRNEMASLEEEGYIFQPYTSAGRIPTSKGFEYYIDNILKPDAVSASEHKQLCAMLEAGGIREMARYIASECHAAAIVMSAKNDFYYTGFTHLLAQPEFSSAQFLQVMGSVIDRLETVLPDIYEEVNGAIRFYVGKKTVLGGECSGIFIATEKKSKTLLGLLSPLRTNYARNAGLLKALVEVI